MEWVMKWKSVKISQWVLTFLCALVSSMAGWHGRIFEPWSGRVGIIFLNLINYGSYSRSRIFFLIWNFRNSGLFLHKFYRFRESDFDIKDSRPDSDILILTIQNKFSKISQIFWFQIKWSLWARYSEWSKVAKSGQREQIPSFSFI